MGKSEWKKGTLSSAVGSRRSSSGTQKRVREKCWDRMEKKRRRKRKRGKEGEGG
jgi:hypothetical protein